MGTAIRGRGPRPDYRCSYAGISLRGDAAASEAVGLTTVPTLFLVGRDGVVHDSVIGFQRHKMEEFAALAADGAGRQGKALFLPGEDVPAIKPG